MIRLMLYTRGRQVIYIGVLKFKIINLWGLVKKIFFKSLYFKNSSIKIILWLLQLIYTENYNNRSMKIKVDRVQSTRIALRGADPDRGTPIADPFSIMLIPYFLAIEDGNIITPMLQIYVIEWCRRPGNRWIGMSARLRDRYLGRG
jgi:hypothetical protein